MNSKQAKITSKNCKQQLQASSEFKTSRNCKQKLQAEIASRNCKQKLQARFEFKTRQIMKLLNQKAKVTFIFFLYFFDRNQPMTQPSAGKKENDGRKSTIVSSLYFILLQQYFPAKRGVV